MMMCAWGIFTNMGAHVPLHISTASELFCSAVIIIWSPTVVCVNIPIILFSTYVKCINTTA